MAEFSDTRSPSELEMMQALMAMVERTAASAALIINSAILELKFEFCQRQTGHNSEQSMGMAQIVQMIREQREALEEMEEEAVDNMNAHLVEYHRFTDFRDGIGPHNDESNPALFEAIEEIFKPKEEE